MLSACMWNSVKDDALYMTQSLPRSGTTGVWGLALKKWARCILLFPEKEAKSGRVVWPVF
jgi:hypothetical protein